ncbi:ribonuclease H-like domain-containing protein [Tanacetum coccineum]
MEFESAQSNTTAKLPILKLDEYEMWVIRIKQYFQMSVPVTAEEKTNKKNDVKARSLQLMALLNEHQLTFSQYSDAKTMFAAIKTRFGGNKAIKKTQKTLLAILSVVIGQEDLNSKFLSILPPEWNTHVVEWMHKAKIKIMSIDDLYNNFKIVEQSVNKSVGASSGAQNLAFMTALSTSSTNDVNTAKPAFEVGTASLNNPNGSNLLQQDIEQIHEDDLEAMDLKWQLSLLSMRAKSYYQRTVKKIFINANDIAGAPRNKEGQFRNQDNTRKQGNNKDTSSKAMLAIYGVGFDWSDMAEEQVQTNMALMVFSNSAIYNDKTCSKTCLKNYETLKKQCDDLIVKLNQTKFTAVTYKRGLATIEEQLITYRKNEVLFSEEVSVLKREVVGNKSSQELILPRTDQGVGSTSGIRACALRYFDLEVIELENSQNNALAKLPMLKLGEYEMWEIRIKQYFQIQDYALWEVIENGNSWVHIPVTSPAETGTSIGTKMTVPSTTEEKTCKKNDFKARSLLLMVLPNEHQLTFDKYVDAQSMFAAIKARFGGNEATKKTQKALLKQQYENFSASSLELLDSIFNRLQRLVSRLEILGVVTPPEDLNVKFLRSLPSEWDIHVVVWMNKPDFDTMVYAFLSTQPQGSQLVHEDLEQLHDDDLEEMDLKWNMALLSMRARKFYQRTGRKIIIDGSSTAGYDKSKVECFNCHKMGHFARECRAPRSKDNRNWNQGSSSKAVRIEDASEKAMCAIDGAGFDWSDMAEDEIQANMALMAFTDSEVSNDKSCSKSCLQNYEALKKQYDDLLVKLDDTGFKAATYKRGLSILEAQVVKYKESEVLFSEEIALLKRSVGHKEYLMGLLKTELEKVKEEKEGFEFKLAKFEKSSKDLDDLLASQVTDKSKKGFGYNAVPSPHPLILNRPTPLDLSYSGLEEFKQPEVNEYGPRDSSLKPTTVCDRESDNSKENTDDSLTQQPKTVTETSSVMSPLKVDKDWKEKFFHPANHIRVEEPKKARENTDAPIIEDWVSDDEEEVEPIPKVEKKTVVPTATKKESVKTVKPIRRSVRYAEMYRSQGPRGNQRNWNGQKSNQLGCNFVFNNKACFICGSFDHIQYSCPNAYKHMVPRAVLMKTGLKTVNNAKPVNTVRSVNTARPFSTARSFNTVRPSYTAHPKSTVSCARPKTHFQNQAQSTVQRPFYKSTALTKRFKDFDGGNVPFSGGANERKNQLVQIENLVDKKVKIIRSDNGTEFKNHVMDVFCREKGIKREYSVARTPQQNGVAERQNRTLIEAARTMLADSKLPTTFLVEAVFTACKAFRVYNIRTRKYKENLLVGFLEITYVKKEMVPSGVYLDSSKPPPNSPKKFWNDYQWVARLSMFLQNASYFDDASIKSIADAQIQDQDGTHDDCSFQENGIDDQQVNTASPQVNTGSREVSTAAPAVNTATPEGLMGSIPTTEDTQVEDQEIELGNISPSYEVSSTPHTRIHKDHPIDHVIGDVQSSVQNKKRHHLGDLTKKELCGEEFEKAYKEKFQMSSMGELTFFLGLQVQQRKKGIFISQDKYVHEILRKFNYTDVKSASTPTDLEKPLVKRCRCC